MSFARGLPSDARLESLTAEKEFRRYDGVSLLLKKAAVSIVAKSKTAVRTPSIAEFELALSAWEGQFVEFKESVSESLAREMVAFANSEGGRIYIGVDDNKTLKGVTITNKLLSQIHDMARNCDPPLLVNLASFKYEEHDLLMVDVPAGDKKPYGCGAGYFLRTGPNTQKMRHSGLVEFVLSLEPAIVEQQDSKRFVYPRDFDRKEFRGFLRLSGISPGRLSTEELLVNLGVARLEGSHLVFNKAGVLLFAKKPSRFLPQSRVTCILFQTPERLHILDRKDLDGALIDNLEQAEVFLLKHLPVRYEIKGFDRIEHLEFPIEVLREGLVNAFMHRDYAVSGGNIFVEIYPDRIAIVNPGGLPPGLSAADFGTKSVHRNPLIADLLLRARRVERVGTGIRRIRDGLAKAGCAEPQFRFTAFFELILPRAEGASAGQVTGQVAGQARGQAVGQVGPYARRIIAYCETPRAMREIMHRLEIKKRDNLTPHIRLLLEARLLALTIPDTPRSRLQKYVTTEAGKTWLAERRSKR